jgi:hypothetical protein
LSGKKRKKGTFQNVKRPARPSTPRWQIAAALAVVLIAYVALRLPGISVPLDRDEGAFGYMGQLINEGKLPYRDGVDHKPPVAFYINALALRFVPPTEQGVHLFLLLYNFLTLVCVFYIGKTYFQSLSTGLWCAFAYGVFSAGPAIQGFTASTEMWMLLPITLSLLLAVLGRRRNSSALLFLSGVSGAAACWTRQSAFTSILFVFVFTGLAFFYRSQGSAAASRAALIRALASWLLGAVLFSALLVFYFYIHGVFREFIYWSFLHNLSYASHRSLGESLDMVQAQLIEIARGDLLIVSAGVIVAAWRLARKHPDAYFILGFLLLSLLGTIPGFGYSHYFAQLAPAVAIAGGYGFSTLLGRCRTLNGRLAASTVCGLLILVVPVSVNSQYFLQRDPNEISRLAFGFNPFPESKALAAFVAQATLPVDPVFIMGSEPQILFCAKRRSPSSFLMFYPLMASYTRYKEFQETVWSEIQRTPPKYVLDMVNIPTSFLWDGQADIDIVNRLNAWLQKEYVVDRVMLVTGLQGEWVATGDSRLQQGVPCVYVLRRKQ